MQPPQLTLTIAVAVRWRNRENIVKSALYSNALKPVATYTADLAHAK